MVIALRVTTDNSGSNSILENLATLKANSATYLRQALAEHQGELDTIFDFVPPAAQDITFINPEQRYAAFGRMKRTAPFVEGGQYVRTGELNAQFFTEVVVDKEGSATLVIGNTAEETRYAVGTFAKDDRQGRSRQQPFHAKTGWVRVNDPTRIVVDKILTSWSAKVGTTFAANKPRAGASPARKG